MSMVEWKNLGDEMKVLRGKRLTKNLLDDNAEYPVFHGGIEPLGKYSQFNRDENTVMVINVGASAGTVGYCNKKFWSSDGCFCISHSDKVNSKYLFYYLQCKTHYLQSQVRYAGIPTLDNSVVEKIKIPFISLVEQKSIVEKLDTFTSSIENLKEQIAQRRKQYEYYRDQLLDLEGKDGIEIKSLKEIVKSYCTGATPKKGTAEFYDGGTVPWLRTQDVRFNEIHTIDSYVTNEAVEKTGIKWIPANCVIIAISGATAGRCAINKIPTTTNQHCLNLEINPKKALYKYVYYCVYNVS